MKNGKVVRQLSVAESKKNGKQMACDWFTRFHFSFGCVTGGGGNGGGEVIIFGTSFVIQGNDPSAGPSLAFTLPLPEGHACAYNQWQFTEADVFIDCSFDGDAPDPVIDFPFLYPILGPVSYGLYGTLQLLTIFDLSFNLNYAERAFYSEFPWMVPQAMNNRADALNRTSEYFCSTNDGFNGNAFQHAYWSALNTWSFGADAARIMGLKHEAENYGNLLLREMDLYNNELGISIASQLPSWYGEESLIASILSAIDNGQGKRNYLSDDPSSFLNFLIPTDNSNRCH